MVRWTNQPLNQLLVVVMEPPTKVRIRPMVFVYKYSCSLFLIMKLQQSLGLLQEVWSVCIVQLILTYSQFIDVCTLNKVDTPQSLGDCLHKPIINSYR